MHIGRVQIEILELINLIRKGWEWGRWEKRQSESFLNPEYLLWLEQVLMSASSAIYVFVVTLAMDIKCIR